MTERTYTEEIRRFNRHYANMLGKIDQRIYGKPYLLSEVRVIAELYEKKDATATEIREKLGIDRGYMSRMIQKFEEENIISKKQASTDKRQFLIQLTDYGEKVHQGLVDDANREVGNIIGALNAQQVDRLTSAMRTVESLLNFEQAEVPRVIIRPYQPGELGYVSYLHGALYSKTYQFGAIFEYYVMKGLAEFMMDSSGGELWIAEVDEEIAGAIAITRSSEDTAQLRWFVLDERFQGLGIGHKLMDFALAFCRTQHYRHVFLWTVSILETARHLYGKYGFTLTEQKANNDWTEDELLEERWDLELGS
ncbi:bifunctional helix-turn-helix transcriptional regulator/GNAT family N-acetyltransferase [Planococcus shenhongbingii]|uniref:Helix-turn-helix domain-containing GNAT family N-acetyltransferase n=1 Tax=Planococcus shenhongbingii TaxID=3058398 RepID=A0ABT8NGE1_9BACL|nr:helix-turn-helix domain-containing GNAT family N-acetyltransferase [Planococcus sp. N017]MDN7246947.1 helix-turn-helix domain-containing GNAT family N-acetyltransferase [Planococcus sp. N017]